MWRAFTVRFSVALGLGVLLGSLGTALAAGIFADVSGDIALAVQALYDAGVVTDADLQDGNYRPDDALTRGEFAIFAQRLLGKASTKGISKTRAVRKATLNAGSTRKEASPAEEKKAAPAPTGAGNLRFTSATFSMPEPKHDVTLVVVRAGGKTGAVSVDYATSDGTAKDGEDYVGTQGTLNFADGETTKTLTVQLKDDTAPENGENFAITLSNPDGVSLGTPPSAIVTLIDNDGGAGTSPSSNTSQTILVPTTANAAGFLSFSAQSYALAESAGTATITVQRTGGSAGAVGVNYMTSNSTAKSGTDYTSTTGTLSFAAGETSKTFTVPIIGDDSAIDGNKMLNVSINTPTGGAQIIGPTTVVFTIVDDETTAQAGNPTIRLNKASYAFSEGDGVAVLTVVRTGNMSVSSSVSYATTAGTAGGSDFTATNGILTFAPGEASKNILVPLLTDSESDGGENFSLTLSAPATAVLGTPAYVSVTIDE